MVFGLFACQKGTPPKEVSAAFADKYPTAEKVQWEQENENEWEAEFLMDGKEMEVVISSTGEIIGQDMVEEEDDDGDDDGEDDDGDDDDEEEDEDEGDEDDGDEEDEDDGDEDDGDEDDDK